jgi:hypothetical protein
MITSDGWSRNGAERAEERAYHQGQCDQVCSETGGEKYRRASNKAIDLRDDELNGLRMCYADARLLLRDGAAALRAHACDCGRDECEPCAVAKRMEAMG